ncbi:Protein T27C4.1 [Aphelenchoides avenae]|nr:Protein T27C4.1 [Aphelenchus avenae]
MAGFVVFAVGASIMALSLIVPTCAHLVGGNRLAAFASGDSTPNEPPIRIYPSAGTKAFKVVPAKFASGHKISPTSGPVPAMEEIAKVQPGSGSKKSSPTADLLGESDTTPLVY